MASLFASLPAPLHTPAVEEEEEEVAPIPSTSTALVSGPVVPPYGQRKGWRPPGGLFEFNDGGAYPEVPIAQYPLDMGRKAKTTAGNTLALQVDSEGNVRYDAIAKQGHREGVSVQSQFKDLVPMAHRTDIKNQAMERPSEEEVQSTADRTRLALDKLVSGKIKAAQPKSQVNTQANALGSGRRRIVCEVHSATRRWFKATYHQNGSSPFPSHSPPLLPNLNPTAILTQQIEVVEDPLEPPKFKGKKIPRGPPSPPPPVLRSPPRKVTAQEQKDWMIPPCVSNWKNNKGYTIPLDKRLAADGRGLQDVRSFPLPSLGPDQPYLFPTHCGQVLINDRFAQFSEALYVADRHAREEVRQRSLMQQRIAQKEKESKEENLRLLAQRAREERSGIVSGMGAVRVSAPTATGAGLGGALAGYGSDSGSEEESEVDGGEGEEEDEKGAREREEIRRERKKEREREMRMSNMGTEQRAKMLARATGRDISEKIALGLAKPTLSKDSMLDSRLFNQEQLAGSFADDDSYNLYDKALFSGSSAAAAIYKPRGANIDDEGNDVNLEEGISKSMQNDRFGLGVAGRGFEGADMTEVRDGPVAFEKDTADPFAIDAFLETAKAGATKRGLDTSKDDSARKRARD
ncbi:SNW domain-containing protein 1, partial [Phenoliferia sp. Uapishka_3]